MIASLSEIKSFLKITDTEHDTFINLNIPIVEQSICDYCNNDFIDKNFDYFSSNMISFINSDNSINLSNINTYKLAVYDSIRVYKSLRNSQTFTIDSILSDKIIVNDIDTIEDEESGDSIYITKIKYPKPLKLTFSKMIGFLINENYEDLNAKEEKIDDYTIVYDKSDLSSQGFPSSIMSSLNCYRQLYKIDLFNRSVSNEYR